MRLTALAVGQVSTKFVALQWIFAFVIMGLLFVLTAGVAYPQATGKEWTLRRSRNLVQEDQERAPLLEDS